MENGNKTLFRLLYTIFCKLQISTNQFPGETDEFSIGKLEIREMAKYNNFQNVAAFFQEKVFRFRRGRDAEYGHLHSIEHSCLGIVLFLEQRVFLLGV